MIDLKCREMRDNLLFYNVKEVRDETDDACVDKVLGVMENDMKRYTMRGWISSYIEHIGLVGTLTVKRVPLLQNLHIIPTVNERGKLHRFYEIPILYMRSVNNTLKRFKNVAERLFLSWSRRDSTAVRHI